MNISWKFHASVPTRPWLQKSPGFEAAARPRHSRTAADPSPSFPACPGDPTRKPWWNPGKMLENAMASRSLTCLFMGDINLHKPSKYGEAVGSYPNSIDCIMALWWQALWIHRPENMLRIPISDSQFVFNIFIVRQSENDTYFWIIGERKYMC